MNSKKNFYRKADKSGQSTRPTRRFANGGTAVGGEGSTVRFNESSTSRAESGHVSAPPKVADSLIAATQSDGQSKSIHKEVVASVSGPKGTGSRGRSVRQADTRSGSSAKTGTKEQTDGGEKSATKKSFVKRPAESKSTKKTEVEPSADRRRKTRPKARAGKAIEYRHITEKSALADYSMLINVTEGEECRIAVMHHNRLEEFFIERADAESHVGNIYKGRVTNIEPSIQAAFIDFGMSKNGFLHISDLRPKYFPEGKGQAENVGRKTPRRDRPPIQKCLSRGQEVIVQIIKEGIGTKGPTLTTYISIPGRYLVMMPGMNRLGVSRKIEDDDARRKMRKVLEEMKLPTNMGFILRTVGLDKTKRDLRRDLMYLHRLWDLVAQKIKNEKTPCELYRESDLVIRTIRDVYSSDFDQIIVDSESTAEKVRDFLAIAMPRSGALVEVYNSQKPLFHAFGVENEMARIHDRYVPLPLGGSLVIDSTEALVAIDVNSGRYRDLEDAEETAYRINLEAADEIARQLRLRDLGGLILCDFIDMNLEKNRRGVEQALREALKTHKERAKCLRMSAFGIIEMTRQRMRPSLKRSLYQDCPHCGGSGLVKNPESMTLDILRMIRLAVHHNLVKTVEVRVSPDVAYQLQNRKRSTIHNLEEKTSRHIVIRADSNVGADQYLFECYDHRGGSIHVIENKELPKERTKEHKRKNQALDRADAEESRTLAEVLD